MARDNSGIVLPTTAANSYYGPVFGVFQPTGAGAGFSYAVGNRIYRETINPDTPALEPEVADTLDRRLW